MIMTVIEELGEIFPFECPVCKGYNYSEYTEYGFCLCPYCDCEKIEKYKKENYVL